MMTTAATMATAMLTPTLTAMGTRTARLTTMRPRSKPHRRGRQIVTVVTVVTVTVATGTATAASLALAMATVLLQQRPLQSSLLQQPQRRGRIPTGATGTRTVGLRVGATATANRAATKLI
jgi:hypothetical protein